VEESISSIRKLGANYSPISDYNKLIGNTLGNVNFDRANQSLNEFQNILNDEVANIQAKNSPDKFSLGISTEDIIRQRFMDSLSEPANKSVSSASPLGNLANNLNNGFNNNINSLNQRQLEAEYAVETLASGGDISVHDVMIATEKANLSMQMAIQLRNRMINAYSELNQMRF